MYLSTDARLRRGMCDYLVHMSCNVTLPWLVMVDFNLILNAQERVGGSQVKPHHFLDFYDCISIMGLLDMRFRQLSYIKQ